MCSESDAFLLNKQKAEVLHVFCRLFQQEYIMQLQWVNEPMPKAFMPNQAYFKQLNRWIHSGFCIFLNSIWSTAAVAHGEVL